MGRGGLEAIWFLLSSALRMFWAFGNQEEKVQLLYQSL